MTRLEMIPENAVVAEVGCQRGEFSRQIHAKGVAALYLIDAWTFQPGAYESDPADIDQGGQDANERHVRAMFKDARNVIIIKEWSHEAARMFPNKHLTVAFIDAAHDEPNVYRDLVAWSPKVTDALLVHDYVDNERSRAMGFGVVKAVEMFCQTYPWKVDCVSDEEWPTARLARL